MSVARFALACIALAGCGSVPGWDDQETKPQALRSRAVGEQPAPPDGPATVELRDGVLTLTYDGRAIFTGTVAGPASFPEQRLDGGVDRALTQTITLRARGAEQLALAGRIDASRDSFPCEAERPVDGERVVRHSFGLSTSTLNRAVYDRAGDWALAVGFGAEASLRPEPSGASIQRYELRASGREIELTFRPRFYQRHRGLRDFAPWNEPLWPAPVVGWCSWFAYGTDVDESKVREVADVLARELAPYGLEYVQIDDGYQQVPPGMPETWLQPNAKFPSGLAALAQSIRARGLEPGLWIMAGFLDDAAADAHPELFLQDVDGRVARGKWIGSVPDYSSPETLAQLVHPLFRALREQGWAYVKLDALRHLRYEGYNTFADDFARRGLDRVAVYRDYVKAVRADLGRDRFLLACWGVRPELAGLVDGCRIGTDGFRWGCLAQYNSFNNVVWRNDPDHIVLERGADYPSCMVTSLTGSLFMVTDKAERYASGDLDAVRRCIPVLVTRPGQLYDVDPSRSSRLAEVDTLTDGGPPAPFDGTESTVTDLFLLELNVPWESWVVLGCMAARDTPIRFASLGLETGERYLVFDLWRETLVGELADAFTPGALDPKFACNAFCIRRAQPNPQLLATDRHVSAGALEVHDVRWAHMTLSGASDLIAGDEYVLFVHEPPGFTYDSFAVAGADVLANELRDGVRRIAVRAQSPLRADWSVRYR